MAKPKHPPKVGRPRADKPKQHAHSIKLDEDEEADAIEDMQRLTVLTGQEWTMSSYMRMCMRAMKGKHLS